MIHDHLKKPLLLALFCLSCAMVYAGAVNQGFSKFFFALPFVGVLIGFSIKYRGAYLVASLVVLTLSGGLYNLKANDSRIFYPANGETLTVVRPLCVSTYTIGKTSILFAEEPFGEGCEDESKTGFSQYSAKGMIERGTVYDIVKTEVSTPDFSETYSFVVNTEFGPLTLSPSIDFVSMNFVKENGEEITESDLRRAVFYYPSLLMNYPILPIMLSSKVADVRGFAFGLMM